MRTIAELKRETGSPVLVADQQGLITYVNACFQTTFGWQPEAVIGQSIAVALLHEEGLRRVETW